MGARFNAMQFLQNEETITLAALANAALLWMERHLYRRVWFQLSQHATNKANLIEILTYCRARA